MCVRAFSWLGCPQTGERNAAGGVGHRSAVSLRAAGEETALLASVVTLSLAPL